MKKITSVIAILLFAHLAMGQENNYNSLWKQVEKHESDRMTKSALSVVETIAKKAKADNNSPQAVKAMLYLSKYAMTLEEDAILSIVNDFKSEISKSNFPTKNVLESYLANLYWQYFQQNRYQFYNRTKTETKVDSVDFRTWDLKTLFEEVRIHFDGSLENPTGLQKIKTSSFGAILHQQKDSETYRPTLYDLLAHTALQFYKTSENNITRPADKFEIDDPNMLCMGTDFVDLPIDTNDKTSLQSKALQLYQDLLKFHKNDSKPDAFAEVDLERLQFVYTNATFTDKDKPYLKTLESSAKKYSNNAISGLYNFQIANIYHNSGNTYQPGTNKENQWKNKEAVSILDAVIKKFPESRAAQNSKNLRASILRSSVVITTEKHIPIDKPSKVLVSYKNLKALNFTAYRISSNGLTKLNKLYPQEKKLAYIKTLKKIKDWNTSLKNAGDFQNHSTEIVTPNLGVGEYLILAQPESEPATFAYATLQVTDLALVSTGTKNDHIFQVINRNNGDAVANVKVNLTYRIDYNKPKHHKTFVTDKMGMVTIPKSLERWQDVNAKITHKDDYAHFGNYYINSGYGNNSGQSDSYASYLFTDRSIYRPGQPLYFKGILVKNAAKTEVQTGTSLTVTMLDANYQKVSSQNFTTNEYGSIAGEFIVPNNGLTGNYQLQIESKAVGARNNVSFSVEEYKRPKFETEFNPVTETYKVNDNITVKGTATAFAGSSISDAKVVYTVKRLVQYPSWYYWRWNYRQSNPQEIKQGETKTDAQGNYEINFIAQPDNSVDKASLPVFNYEITADITDINGETRSASTVVRVGYHCLTASISVASTLDKNKKENKISITTNNLNGQFVATKGKLKMYKLKAPNSVKRARPWNAPDYKMAKTDFNRLFPYETHENNNEPSQWKKGKLVWESSFDTGKSKEIELKNAKKWISGNYIIELETKDKFGQKVTDKAITQLFANDDKKLSDNQLFKIKTDKDSYKIGDNAKITLLSAAKNLNVTVYIEKGNKIIDKQIINLNNNSKTITVPVTKEDEGGFGLSYSFSAYNSFVNGNVTISVPYPKTDLEIETLTFRDKLKPGTDETWQFKIKGPKGDKVTAEILASMYDASLDEFRTHNWYFNPINRPYFYSSIRSNAHNNFNTANYRMYKPNSGNSYGHYQGYDSFNWFGLNFGGRNYYRGNMMSRMVKKSSAPMPSMVEDGEALEEVVVMEMDESEFRDGDNKEKVAFAGKREDSAGIAKKSDAVQIRKNLQETAFFFPQLQTDKDGNVSFSFTTPEALTKWKMQLLAHTKSLSSAMATMETVTQKELMVMPNPPRFLREGDKITFSTKISNVTDKALSGSAKLELKDAFSGEDITNQLISPLSGEMPKAEGAFSVDAKGNTQVSWSLEIPKGLQAVQYTIIAKAGDYSDGEQNVLPVLTNRMLVTETLPMWVRSNQTKKFSLDKLKDNTSTTLTNHKLTLEITSNPAWYAVQALPYLMEYPHECNEQMFSRYYANTLASHIANSNPRIQEVFKQWANSDALLSNLEKNQELKSILIQETPWLRDAQSETEQKKRIALLFNLNKMKSEQANALRKLQQNQMNSGAWSWFKGGRENRYITQHIISGLGHLKKLDVRSSAPEASGETSSMIKKAIGYLDAEFVKEYEYMKRHSQDLSKDHLSHTQLHYLYMRSFFPEVKSNKKTKEITAYYKGQAQKYWQKRSLYSKGLLALILHRMDDSKTSTKIIKSLEQNSITSEELGMYWKSNTGSWHWYQAPIETQALMIEAFGEIRPKDIETVDNLKIWLLKNKQTNQWKTTKATTEAVYALLLQGSEWLSVTDAVDVLIGGKKIDPSKLENVKVEAGTGYYKTAWNGKEVKQNMADIQISKKGKGIAWGAMYWQYFEDLDKITSAETPLKLKKKLFLKNNTGTGEEISEITSKTKLKVGDLVRVRIELRADRPMEFVHMKDMRASGLEPINVMSRYKWQDGLGYYESTKDASTNFFFDFLPKGVFVFEYDLRVNNAGNFSSGITTIQSMYAPEFSSHSEGVRVNVE